MITLAEMRSFVAVVRLGSFTEAAKEIGVTKACVSKHVSSLEACFETKLLIRTTRSVSPTEIGLACRERCAQTLKTASETCEFMASVQATPSGLLRVRTLTDFGVNKMASVVNTFLEKFPDVTMEMSLSNLYVAPSFDGFDVVIFNEKNNSQNLQARQLSETTKHLVASRAYLGKNGRPERIDHLKDHQLLTHSSKNSLALTGSCGELREVRSSPRLAINDGQSLLEAAISGLGIAYLPDYLYADALVQGHLEVVLPSLVNETGGIYAVCQQERAVEHKIRAFIDFLETELSPKSNDAALRIVAA